MKSILACLLLLTLVGCDTEAELKPNIEPICGDSKSIECTSSPSLKLNFNFVGFLPDNFKIMVEGNTLYDSCSTNPTQNGRVKITKNAPKIIMIYQSYNGITSNADVSLIDRGVDCTNSFRSIINYSVDFMKTSRSGQTWFEANIYQ